MTWTDPQRRQKSVWWRYLLADIMLVHTHEKKYCRQASASNKHSTRKFMRQGMSGNWRKITTVSYCMCVCVRRVLHIKPKWTWMNERRLFRFVLTFRLNAIHILFMSYVFFLLFSFWLYLLCSVCCSLHTNGIALSFVQYDRERRRSRGKKTCAPRNETEPKKTNNTAHICCCWPAPKSLSV